MSVGFKPAEPPRPPRLEHVRDLWRMHRPHRPHAVLVAAIYRTIAGHELRVGFSIDNLFHSELSQQGDAALETRAEDIRVTLTEQGWIELRAADTAH